MIANTSYYNVFQEILQLCSYNMGFTKNDVDDMPPFERMGYIHIIKTELEKEKVNNGNK